MNLNFNTPPKAGDKVVLIQGRPSRIMTVRKVTPTGIVRTEEGLSYKPGEDGVYRQNPHSGYIGTERIGFTEIAPYTPELEEQANQYQREKKEKEDRKRTVDAAKSACHDMGNWNKSMSYETAVKILEIYKAWEAERR